MATRTITVNGGNLFVIAMQQLGDATQWNRIAELNGLGIDPILPTGVRLVLAIPDRDASAGGGIFGGVQNGVSIYKPTALPNGIVPFAPSVTSAINNTGATADNNDVPLLGVDNVPLIGLDGVPLTGAP